METGAPASTRLTTTVTVKAPPGLGDQIRAAARAEGVRPGELIRTAIAERIERAGVPPTMTPENRAELVGVLGEGFARNVERTAADPEFCADMDRRVSAARFAFMDRIISAHEHLAAYIKAQAARAPDEVLGSDAAAQIAAAYADIDGARQIEMDLGRAFVTEVER